jgi:serine/threonine-protein kinase
VPRGARSCGGCGFDLSTIENVGAARAGSSPLGDTSEHDPMLEELRRLTAGEYEVLCEIGQGGMATVYLAHDLTLDRKVAIKLMAPNLYQHEGMVGRFLLEARTAAQLSHPHIIPIYAVRQQGRTLYFVMKYVAGVPLDGVIAERGPLPIPWVLTVLSQVGSALEYAHRKGVIHRDIKPPNILIDEDGWAVVMDFGIAKVAQATGLTVTGATVGTPHYMSPEQCKGAPVTGAADQYALGMVAYELITGTVPFDSETVMSVMWAHVNEPPPPIAESRADCPQALIEIVDRMLAKEPGDRWPSMSDLLSALGSAATVDHVSSRAELSTMARAGAETQPLTRLSTPRSPVPTGDGIPPTRHSLSPAEGRSVAALSLAPQAASVVAGASVRLEARITKAEGGVAAGAVVTWESSDPAVASVAADGLVTGESPGAATITAVCSGRIAHATVTVTPAPSAVASLEVEPSRGTLAVGESVLLMAVVLDRNGEPVPSRGMTWRAIDTGVATVTSGGLVHALRVGSAKIRAECEGRTGEAVFNISRVGVAKVRIHKVPCSANVGDVVQLMATAHDQFGELLRGRVMVWTSSDSKVASVTRTGAVQMLAPGTVLITVSNDGKSAVARIISKPAAPVACRVHPAAHTLSVQDELQLTAEAVTAKGFPIPGSQIKWASSNPSIATISEDGVVRAMKAGTAIIAAEAGGKKATARITVRLMRI